MFRSDVPTILKIQRLFGQTHGTEKFTYYVLEVLGMVIYFNSGKKMSVKARTFTEHV